MKTVFRLVLSGFLSLYSYHIASAQILDLDLALSDPAYQRQIEDRFKQVKELQIGGTHRTGNRTVIKEDGKATDRLDPQILNINPKEDEHDAQNPDVLSIVGNGFDFELLAKLQKLCSLYEFRFQRIYINNVDIALSIPAPFDLVRASIYSPGRSELVHVADPSYHFDALYKYTRQVIAKKVENLYSVYNALLVDGGFFIFKQCEQAASANALQAVLTNIDQSMDPAEKKKRKKLYAKLFSEIDAKLKKVGMKVDLQNTYADVDTEPQRMGPYYKIQMQTLLLKAAGFRSIKVSVGKFRSWGYLPDVDVVYATVIEAEKPASRRK